MLTFRDISSSKWPYRGVCHSLPCFRWVDEVHLGLLHDFCPQLRFCRAHPAVLPARGHHVPVSGLALILQIISSDLSFPAVLQILCVWVYVCVCVCVACRAVWGFFFFFFNILITLVCFLSHVIGLVLRMRNGTEKSTLLLLLLLLLLCMHVQNS